MGSDSKTISGNIVDVLNSEVYKGRLVVADGRIADIIRDDVREETCIMPGFIDSHIHIESSMLPPSEFARPAVIHGTVAVVADPHEIANVLGVEGVRYMIESAGSVPMKFFFGAPSCVPASPLDDSGATLGPSEVEELLSLKETRFLAEVMDFPGVLGKDPALHQKIRIANRLSKAIDGHAPGLRGKDLKGYIDAGITTDHESLSLDEALEKISLGMKVQIREGSAARSADTLLPLLEGHAESCMFCSDDKHPDDLVKGHINEVVKRALAQGIDKMKVLRAACVNPVLHYGLDVGLLRRGDPADFLVVDNLSDLNILGTYINGDLVAERGESMIPGGCPEIRNRFVASAMRPEDLVIKDVSGLIHVIGAMDGGLVTEDLLLPPRLEGGCAVSDPERDILKIAVINRYGSRRVGKGFVRGFGLRRGAMASSVAHDSHNIVAVGVTDQEICRAVNLVIAERGGIGVASKEGDAILPLPLAGIMSDGDYRAVAERYASLDRMAKSLGSSLRSPLMTLSFMALPVIPSLKMSDRGLVDVVASRFVELSGNR